MIKKLFWSFRNVFLWVILVSMMGCDPVASFRSASGHQYKNCGEIEIVFGSCPVKKPVVLTCLVEAFKKCEPAHLMQTKRTVEGAPIIINYFVVPRVKGCKVVVFRDITRDTFAKSEDRKIHQEDCYGLKTIEISHCFQADASKCEAHKD